MTAKLIPATEAQKLTSAATQKTIPQVRAEVASCIRSAIADGRWKTQVDIPAALADAIVAELEAKGYRVSEVTYDDWPGMGPLLISWELPPPSFYQMISNWVASTFALPSFLRRVLK